MLVCFSLARLLTSKYIPPLQSITGGARLHLAHMRKQFYFVIYLFACVSFVRDCICELSGKQLYEFPSTLQHMHYCTELLRAAGRRRDILSEMFPNDVTGHLTIKLVVHLFVFVLFLNYERLLYNWQCEPPKKFFKIVPNSLHARNIFPKH